MGVDVVENDESVVVDGDNELTPVRVKTLPYPGFPTDMNPQMCALMCLAQGTSYMNEGVFENRFRYTGELAKMGASIKVDGKMAVIEGLGKLQGACVRAVDLRAGAAMVIAGLAAEGVTYIEDIRHIERGYEDLVGKLANAGADIRRETVPEEAVQKAN